MNLHKALNRFLEICFGLTWKRDQRDFKSTGFFLWPLEKQLQDWSEMVPFINWVAVKSVIPAVVWYNNPSSALFGFVLGTPSCFSTGDEQAYREEEHVLRKWSKDVLFLSSCWPCCCATGTWGSPHCFYVVCWNKNIVKSRSLQSWCALVILTFPIAFKILKSWTDLKYDTDNLAFMCMLWQ